jgi:hypothetical protein
MAVAARGCGPGRLGIAAVRGPFATILFALCLAAACDAPESSRPVGAAVVKPQKERNPLPGPVTATVELLRQVGAEGSYREMARLAEATPTFRSNNAGMSHADYWYLKTRTGDWPGAHLVRILGYRHAVEDSTQGKVYIWPYMAVLKPGEITEADAREIDRLLGRGQADALRAGEIWPGYVLGVREDGLWLYFVSGSG